jgi:hypothetical protein
MSLVGLGTLRPQPVMPKKFPGHWIIKVLNVSKIKKTNYHFTHEIKVSAKRFVLKGLQFLNPISICSNPPRRIADL